MLAEKASEKASQLVEVIRTCEIYILTNGDFITFPNISDAKDHHWHMLTQFRAFTYLVCGSDDTERRPSQADQNQVRMLSLSAVNRVSFIPRHLHAVAICLQQLLYPIAGLLYVFYHEDGQARITSFHKVITFYRMNVPKRTGKVDISPETTSVRAPAHISASYVVFRTDSLIRLVHYMDKC
jgi:hypothetical protein